MNGPQLQAMLWLRWRLTCSQWRRGGEISAALTLIMAIIGLGLAGLGGIAGVVGGVMGMSQASPHVTMLVWDGLVILFLSFWTIGLVTELQRAEIIDLSRLLHLPISLWDVFLLNYFASHLSFSLAMILPAMLGLTLGLMLGRGAVMGLLFPLVFGFFFMITAWTYCLRGWLAELMVNKRRRRTVIMGVTIAFVLLFQFPNLLINVWGGIHPSRTPSMIQEQTGRNAAEKSRIDAMVDRIHTFVPFLWLPQGAKALAENRVGPALWGALGMFLLGTWGLAHAYRAMLRFYQGGAPRTAAPARSAPPVTGAFIVGGASHKSASTRSIEPTTSADRRLFVERTLPTIPEEATAMAFACLRSMSRAPEVKMILGSNVLVFMLLGATFLMRGKTGDLPAAIHPFVSSAVVVVTYLGLTQMMFNHFGFDRGGFRALVLSPAPRRHILMGKNLALLPVALVVFAVNLGLATVFAHLRMLNILAAGFEFGAAFLVLSVLGNLASIIAPYRIADGSLKPTKMSGKTQLLILATHLLFPLAMLPVFLPAALGLLSGLFSRWAGAVVTLVSAILLAALSVLFYGQMLEPLGRLLQRREQRILQVVTQEVE